MSWLRMDDAMLDHPKWIRALRDGGDAALHLWLRFCAWSSRHLTDGIIPADVIDAIPGPRGAKVRARAQQALADASLIERRSNGDLLLHDYLEYNPSRAEVMAERGRKAQNQRDRRLRGSVTGDSVEHEAGESPVSHRVPSPPLPSPLDPQEERESSARAHVARSVPKLDVVQKADVPPDSEPESSPCVTEIRSVVPPVRAGPLKPGRRERQREAEAARLGTTPALKHKFDPDWEPHEQHRIRGHENGFTDEEILEKAEDCRRKTYKHPFDNDDDQFFRELGWMKKDRETKRFQEQERHGRERFENPGRDRASR